MPEALPVIQVWQERFEHKLSEYLPDASQLPLELYQAMRYSSLAGGKRIRPLFVYASGRALGVEEAKLDATAVAILQGMSIETDGRNLNISLAIDPQIIVSTLGD